MMAFSPGAVDVQAATTWMGEIDRQVQLPRASIRQLHKVNLSPFFLNAKNPGVAGPTVTAGGPSSDKSPQHIEREAQVRAPSNGDVGSSG
jgi:hypothetical protein